MRPVGLHTVPHDQLLCPWNRERFEVREQGLLLVILSFMGEYLRRIINEVFLS
jgi:hypothetical protein